MEQFQAILDSIDMEEITVWQSEAAEVETIEGSLISSVPRADAASVQEIYEELIKDPTVYEVLTSDMTAENISQAAALNGTVSGSSASRLAAA